MARARLGFAWRSTLAAGLSLLCIGCAPRDTVLTFWCMGREGEVVSELMPEFERAHPGLRVRVQQLPWTAAHARLLTAFVGEATPDLADLGNTWIPELAALRALEPLDPYLASTPSVDRQDYFAGIWQTNVVERTLFGVPWYVDTRVIFYRRDLLAAAGIDAPPRNWRQWQRALAAVKALPGPDHYAILLPLNEFEPLTALALQQPEPLLREDGRFGNFESQGFARALAFYIDLFRQGWAPPVTNNEMSNVWDEFGRGYFSFYISGPWNIGEFRRRLPAELQHAWATAPLPGPDGPGASIAGGSSLVLFRASRHKAQAWQLIEYLSSPQVQSRFFELTGDMPARRSAWRTPALAGDEPARAFLEQLERAKPAPPVPEWEQIEEQLQLVAALAVRGQFSADQAARELDRRVDRILDKRRWMLARAGSAHMQVDP